MSLASTYRLIESSPSVTEYVILRQRAGLTPRTPEQAEAALQGSWAVAHVVDASDVAVGMGRVIGDGGWYFHVVDMAVLPEHQKRGIGDAILRSLLDQIAQRAPAAAYISLLADEPGRRLYERHGFVSTAPRSIGMFRPVVDDPRTA